MIKQSITSLLATAALSASASAAITVQDSYINDGSTGAGITVDAVTATTGEVWTFTNAALGLSAASSDKLVVSVASRRQVGQTVMFGGVPMLEAAYQSGVGSNDGSAGIYYLDTFTLGDSLVITSNGTTTNNWGDFLGVSFMVYVLSGTEDGTAALTDTDDGTGGTSVSLTTGSTGGFVLSATGTFNNPASETFTSGAIGTVDAGQSQQAAWNGTTATTYSYSTTGSDGGAVMAAFAPAAFAPVPEPSSFVLLGLGIAGFAVRRRR